MCGGSIAAKWRRRLLAVYIVKCVRCIGGATECADLATPLKCVYQKFNYNRPIWRRLQIAYNCYACAFMLWLICSELATWSL